MNKVELAKRLVQLAKDYDPYCDCSDDNLSFYETLNMLELKKDLDGLAEFLGDVINWSEEYELVQEAKILLEAVDNLRG